jgi:hypothetical protein
MCICGNITMKLLVKLSYTNKNILKNCEGKSFPVWNLVPNQTLNHAYEYSKDMFWCG